MLARWTPWLWTLAVVGLPITPLACGGSDEPTDDPDPPSGGDPTMLFGGGSAGEAATSGGGTASASGGSGNGGDTGGTTATPSAGSGGVDTGFIECLTLADCEAFGGGKVCCDTGSIGFCTKPGACPGETRP